MSVLLGVDRCVLLHEGGEARIYKVFVGTRAYVLKWYAEGARIDAGVMERLSREKFAGVYHVLEMGTKARRPYLVYDFVEGSPIAGALALPVPFALSVARGLARSLGQLAEREIHHGDLNPSNVLLDREGSPTLIDCGIVGPGALPYAAPERFQGRAAGTKSDIYSLGLLLYRMVAGEDLLDCVRYEDYASAASQIESMEPTSRLYGKGVDAQALSALEPLWKATLRANPDDRAEDFEELDELLEIAFDKTCGGSVSWETLRADVLSKLSPKNGTISDEGAVSCEIPPEFVVTRPTSRRKIALCAGVFGTILILVIVLSLALSRRGPTIDETGAQMLRNSRALEDAGMPSDTADAGVSGKVLETLPLPGEPGENVE